MSCAIRPNPTIVFDASKIGRSTMLAWNPMPTDLRTRRFPAAAIKGSELIVIEQCGHLITIEKPDETNATLRKWLTAQGVER